MDNASIKGEGAALLVEYGWFTTPILIDCHISRDQLFMV